MVLEDVRDAFKMLEHFKIMYMLSMDPKIDLQHLSIGLFLENDAFGGIGVLREDVCLLKIVLCMFPY